MYFVNFDMQYGYGLWRTDGTAEGTKLLRYINAGVNSEIRPKHLVAYNNSLYFTADDGTGVQLWKSNGTGDGTVRVIDASAGLSGQELGEFAEWRNLLWFRTESGRMFKTDGSPGGTTEIPGVPTFAINGIYKTKNDAVTESTLFFATPDESGYNGNLWGLTADGEGGTDGEGAMEGGGEGAGEGEGLIDGEGDMSPVALPLLSGFFTNDIDQDGRLSMQELIEALGQFEEADFNALDLNGDALLQISELLSATGGEGGIHTADFNGDFSIGLAETLRLIQLYNATGYHCAANAGASDDGFLPGRDISARGCLAHAIDYQLQDWRISLTELLRLIQFYNIGGYAACENGEDGFCPDAN